MTTAIINRERRYVDTSDWLTQLDAAYSMAKTAGWEFLFTLRAGIDQFGRSDFRRMEMYELAATQIGLNVRTLQNYVSVTRKGYVQMAVALDLDMGHANAVLGLDDEHAEDVLQTAAERNLSVAETRRLAWGHRASARLDVSSPNGSATVHDNVREEEEIPFADPHSPLYTEGGPVREVAYCPHCGGRL